MKAFCYIVLLILLILVSCLPVQQAEQPANQPPIAYIDSVSASEITPGEVVTFTGHGDDTDGSIIAYSWRSSIDGELSTTASFSTSSLSPGTHSIWFKVQDDNDKWSNEVFSNVNVVSLSDMPPVINLFEATPQQIAKGEFSTIMWDVSNASSVIINNNIGYVSSIGDKVLSPYEDTVYKLTATNKNGSVEATVAVTLLTEPMYTEELYAIAAESGHVRSDGFIGKEPYVGAVLLVHSGLPAEAFLSYDITNIPQGKKIKTVYLDVNDAKIYGNPFLFLGSMYIYVCNYNQLSRRDYVDGNVGGHIYSTGRMASKLLSSPRMTEAIQTAVDSGSSRFQLRLQFVVCNCRQDEIGYIDFGGAGSKLVIKYQD